MKWSIFVCLLVCLASYCDGLAIKCSPGVIDPSCTEEKKEVDRHESQPRDPTEVQCLVGSEWESNCHYCRCSDEGVAECLRQDTCDKGVFAEPVLCKPNTTFQRDCNTCICLENGLGLCTLEFCRRSGSIDSFPEILIADTELNSKDEASQPFKTEIVVPTTKSAKNKTKSRVCEANRMFIKDCNTCWCNEDGTSYYCTRRVCVPLLPEDQPDIGGIPAENATLSRKVRSLTTEPPKACKPGQEFRMDCNKCLCDNKGQDFSCTRHDCNALNNNHASAFTGVRSKREISEQLSMQCVPGSVFDRGCNVCKCTDNGQFATCTLKRCKTETDHAPESDQGFRCNPGEQFKRDCNDCTCSADGRSVFCTLRLCDEALTSDI
ncbi:uncharacterized protein LOC118277363 isoform X3 [Spodoptera frugiperda]|uniref:Uncharacterized protein LOC118277363 isoform X3 n=1 Tax=Spodoptera frugiperda TaxID=7108 RepID=A0A9R0DS60_SPOFR|nr:uncharacterized protein LOC118277363 isoform X3 [Spodoptera frugiperda]